MVYAMICRVSTILLVVQDWLQASNIVRYSEINMDEFLTRLWLQKVTSLPEMDRVRDMIVAVMKAGNTSESLITTGTIFPNHP